MANAHKKVTAQGQMAVPADVHRNPGLEPGVSSEDFHRALFGARTPKKRSIEEMKEGIRRYIRKRYARG